MPADARHPNRPQTDDLKDWWPCACKKGGNWRKGKASTHMRLNSPFRKRCSRCGCTKADYDEMVRRATRLGRIMCRALVFANVTLMVVVISAGCSGVNNDAGPAIGINTFITNTLKPIPHRTTINTVIWWSKNHEECYLSVDLRTSAGEAQKTGFVTVPDEWCEGMR